MDTLLIVDPDELGRTFVCRQLAAIGRQVDGVSSLAEAEQLGSVPTMGLISAPYAIELGAAEPTWNPDSLATMCVVYSMRELDEEEGWLASLPSGITAIVTHDIFPALPDLVGAQLAARWRILSKTPELAASAVTSTGLPPANGTAGPGASRVAARDPGWIPRPEDFSITEDDPVDLKLYEIKAILRAISCASGNRQRAAELLGIGKSTLYRRLAEWRDAKQLS